MPTTAHDDAGFEYDPEAAKNGYDATAELRAKVQPGSLPALDLGDASVLGLTVSRELLKPEVRSRYEALPEALFDPALLDLIEPLSWGLWYANTERITLEATSAGGRVSMATLNAGGSVKERMLKVADYVLSDEPATAREIADIRSGTGHTDLASDLTRLAKLYDEHAAMLATDGGKHYRAEDSTEAKRLAAKILLELGEGQTKALGKAKDDAARAFAALEDAYERIRRFGNAIWNVDDRWPSLFSVRQASPRRSSATDTTRVEADTDTTETA